MIINKLIHRQHLMALLEGGTIFYKHGLVKVTEDMTLRVHLVFFLYFIYILVLSCQAEWNIAH